MRLKGPAPILFDKEGLRAEESEPEPMRQEVAVELGLSEDEEATAPLASDVEEGDGTGRVPTSPALATPENLFPRTPSESASRAEPDAPGAGRGGQPGERGRQG